MIDVPTHGLLPTHALPAEWWPFSARLSVREFGRASDSDPPGPGVGRPRSWRKAPNRRRCREDSPCWEVGSMRQVGWIAIDWLCVTQTEVKLAAGD